MTETEFSDRTPVLRRKVEFDLWGKLWVKSCAPLLSVGGWLCGRMVGGDAGWRAVGAGEVGSGRCL